MSIKLSLNKFTGKVSGDLKEKHFKAQIIDKTGEPKTF